MTKTRLLSLKEAAAAAGKSRSTIRRYVEGIVKQKHSEQRIHIHPLPKDYDELRKNKKPFQWRISEQLLREHFLQARDSSRSTHKTPSEPHSNYAELIAVFRDQLAAKDQQIDQLNERLRESHVLVRDLHQRLALPERSDAVADGETNAEPGIKEAPETKPPEAVQSPRPSSKKKRSGIARWLVPPFW